MFKIVQCNGIKHDIRIIRVMRSYKKAVEYAITLKESTGKMYKIERV